jgi:hypothetical protein
LDSAPINTLLIDAYAAQHPGQPSPQAIQSVAVHLLALYGVLVKGLAVDQALWIRRRALREDKQGKHSRFEWLTPPALNEILTVADIVQETTTAARTEKAGAYIRQVWATWAKSSESILADWYEQYVIGD